jgi:hypothetical protein
VRRAPLQLNFSYHQNIPLQKIMNSVKIPPKPARMISIVRFGLGDNGKMAHQ